MKIKLILVILFFYTSNAFGLDAPSSFNTNYQVGFTNVASNVFTATFTNVDYITDLVPYTGWIIWYGNSPRMVNTIYAPYLIGQENVFSISNLDATRPWFFAVQPYMMEGTMVLGDKSCSQLFWNTNMNTTIFVSNNIVVVAFIAHTNTDYYIVPRANIQDAGILLHYSSDSNATVLQVCYGGSGDETYHQYIEWMDTNSPMKFYLLYGIPFGAQPTNLPFSLYASNSLGQNMRKMEWDYQYYNALFNLFNLPMEARSPMDNDYLVALKQVNEATTIGPYNGSMSNNIPNINWVNQDTTFFADSNNWNNIPWWTNMIDFYCNTNSIPYPDCMTTYMNAAQIFQGSFSDRIDSFYVNAKYIYSQWIAQWREGITRPRCN